MKLNHYCISFFVILLFFGHSEAATILRGDPSAPLDQSFPFALNAHIQNNLATNFYVAADPSVGPDIAKEFAIAATTRGSDVFQPFSPEIVNLNGVPNSFNPLFDKGIAFLGLLQGELVTSGGFGTRGEHLIGVSSADRQTIYIMVDFLRETINKDEECEDSSESESSAPSTVFRLHMRSATNNESNIHNVPDATGQVTGGIVGLVGCQAHVLACVKPNSGNFGDPGSGVAEVVLGAVQQSAVFTIVNAKTGTVTALNKAAKLDRSSKSIKIGSNVVSIDDIVDMHWDQHLGRVFIGLRVQGGPAANDGARAVVVARFEESDATQGEPEEEQKKRRNKLVLDAIAPDSSFDGAADKIVGALGADSVISIHKIRTMRTSTGLYYLIVVGGNGLPDDTTQQVFALPLVNGVEGHPELTGTIADKNSIPEDVYTGTPEIMFLGARRRNVPAVEPSQMPTNNDIAARIGGGDVPYGEIKDIFVSRDAVFITVLEGEGDQQPGTFSSQALFDENGVIFGWTNWQRVGGQINQVLGGGVDPLSADIYSMISVNGQVNTVTRTDWGRGTDDGLILLSNSFSVALPQSEGGIRGLFDVPVTAPGLFDCSLLIGVGRDTVLLGQTGIVDSGALIPIGGEQFRNMQTFENGEITTTLPVGVDDPTLVAITGGDLSEISPIIAAEIIASNSQGWLVCGGCRGLAILSDEAGAGWDLATGLGPNFQGLTKGMSFKRIGDYTLIRKLMYDEGYLYILTDTKLDRIKVNAKNIGLGNMNPITLATVERVPGAIKNGVFLDFVVSGKFAVIATSSGLIRVGNNADISKARKEADVDWTWVPVPESGGPVYKLITFTSTGRAQDLTQNFGGNLYALGANRGKERAQLNRFVVHGQDVIDDTMLLPLPDLFIKDRPSFLVNFGDQRTVFATDGSVFFHARSREHQVNARVDALPILQSPPASGFRFQGPRSSLVNTGIPTDSFIGSILRESASGSWLISGDFGLRVNE